MPKNPTQSNKSKTPKLRFPGFDGVWEEKRLGDLGKTYNGLSGKTAEDFGQGEPFVTYKQIFDNSEININNFAFVKVLPNEKQNRAEFGDVFFTTSSETPLEVGFASVLLNQTVKPFLNSFSFGFRLNKKLDPYFAKFLFRSSVYRREVVKLAQGSTRYNISKIEFLKIKTNIPTLGEQQKIASFLGGVDAWIENLQEQKKSLESYKKGLIQKIFSQQIRFKDENGNDFPEREEKRLGEYLIHLSSRNKNYSSELVLSVSNKFGFIAQTEQFEDHRVASKDVNNYKIVNKNEFAYNPSRINVGSIARLINFDQGIVSPMYVVFKLKKLDPIFFENFTKTHSFCHMVKVGCSGSVRESLSFEDMASFKTKFPSLPEQQKIAEFLSSVDTLLESKQQQITKAEEWKKGLMQGLFV